MNDLLLEIGTEEIPADYIEPALNALSTLLLKRLTEARIEHGDVSILGTPRRLAVMVTDVAGRQKPLTTDVTGPPAKVGFDENGMPTIAAKRFAEKVKVAVNSLTTIETEKGSYLCARRIERGNDTGSILKGILPDLVLSIPFPKKMKWADLSIEFARPIHSILALFGDKVIPFVLGNVKSGRYMFGHSFMNPGRIRLSKPDEYVEALRLAHVLVNMEERKKQVVSGIDKAAREQGGRVLQDDDLVDIVNNLVEYPAIVAGNFDKAFLGLPPEVLITAMREHQKYFAVIDKKKNLMPFFIAVNNTHVKDMALVARGHERVLRARLEDAQFFYRSDLEKSLKDLAEKLKGVLFQARLGSVYEKIIRVRKLAEFLADTAGFSPDVKKDVSRAAFLCKADLVSQIVIEFPKLQGVMGRVYAAAAGESDTVASAI
ncbi:MAG: glycine--tRNA ligase subunit beta, partial [Deltaproteobacteria bacterium]|nr:glycine--tRNA ligase subunit beta [Deltaproteobacteria bacterium]